MKKRIIACVLIGVLLLAALSACKRPDEKLAAASIRKERSAEYQKLAAEKAEENGFSLEAEGELAEQSLFRLPEGVPVKSVYVNGAACQGAEEYFADSFRAGWDPAYGALPEKGDEYVYYFDDSLLAESEWFPVSERLMLTLSSFSKPDYSSYVALTAEFGEDGWIVIGCAAGAREGRLACYEGLPLTQGFTLTDFVIEEVLEGTPLNGPVRIKENYFYASDGEKNYLTNYSNSTFALRNGRPYLLFIKKCVGQECYEIFGGGAVLPLTSDYKAYDQDYLDHLARYLNRMPQEFDTFFREKYGTDDPEQSVYVNERIADQTGRDLKEALAANADDPIVALAQKYRIRIWPRHSAVFEEEQLPATPLANKGCEPDRSPTGE